MSIYNSVGASGSCRVCGLVVSSSYSLCGHLYVLKFSSNWNTNFTQRSCELCHRDTVESMYGKIDETDEKQTEMIISLATTCIEHLSPVVCEQLCCLSWIYITS